jgi:hypothetical protein
MTIKLFCKQIEVVDYESFHYTDYYYCIGVFACLVPLNFFKLRKYYTCNYTIYTLYFVVFILIIMSLLGYSEPEKTTVSSGVESSM